MAVYIDDLIIFTNDTPVHHAHIVTQITSQLAEMGIELTRPTARPTTATATEVNDLTTRMADGHTMTITDSATTPETEVQAEDSPAEPSNEQPTNPVTDMVTAIIARELLQVAHQRADTPRSETETASASTPDEDDTSPTPYNYAEWKHRKN